MRSCSVAGPCRRQRSIEAKDDAVAALGGGNSPGDARVDATPTMARRRLRKMPSSDGHGKGGGSCGAACLAIQRAYYAPFSMATIVYIIIVIVVEIRRSRDPSGPPRDFILNILYIPKKIK